MDTNDKYISIPPYLSTSWKHVRSLHMKENRLVVTLIDGSTVEVPNISSEVVDRVFAGHATYLQHQSKRPSIDNPRPPESITSTQQTPQFRFGIGNMEGLGSAMQHDPSQASTPDLPPEILEKVVAVAKVLAPDELQSLPQPELNCNCVHCQIARAIHMESEQNLSDSFEEAHEDPVSAAELSFRDWEIQKVEDNLYTVTNPLDNHEQYRVFLGNPVGCTCGRENCEHVIAVLRS
jgi:hypothetical protein